VGQAIDAVTGTRHFGRLCFLRKNVSLYAAANITFWLLLCKGWYTSPLTHR
jgi:hypothetical protein